MSGNFERWRWEMRKREKNVQTIESHKTWAIIINGDFSVCRPNRRIKSKKRYNIPDLGIESPHHQEYFKSYCFGGCHGFWATLRTHYQNE